MESHIMHAKLSLKGHFTVVKTHACICKMGPNKLFLVLSKDFILIPKCFPFPWKVNFVSFTAYKRFKIREKKEGSVLFSKLHFFSQHTLHKMKLANLQIILFNFSKHFITLPKWSNIALYGV